MWETNCGNGIAEIGDLLWKCCKNIVDVTSFFLFLLFHRFRNLFPPPPPPNFWQCHCHNCYFFFYSPISAMALTQLVCQIFFFFPLRAIHAHPGSRIGHKKFGIPLPKFNIFSLHFFLLLFHTFGWISATVIPKFNLSPQNLK